MNARRNLSVLATICLAVVLTACGNDSPASTPTSVATESVTATATSVAKIPTVVPSLATPVIGVTPGAGATPVVEATALTGTVTLLGDEHINFYIADTGCYGLGEWRGLQPGSQVVVRNAAGTVVDVSELVAADGDGCSWTFETEAPVDAFVSISVPMVLEHWITAADVASGSVVIELP